MRIFILAPTPMMQAEWHSLLASNEIQIIGTSAQPDALSEIAMDIDVVVVADELLLEEFAPTLYDLEAASQDILATSYPSAEQFAKENVLEVDPAIEATIYFESIAIED